MHPYPLMSLFIFGFYVVNKCSLNIIQTWISAAANRPPISQAESWLIPSLNFPNCWNNGHFAVFFFKSPGWRGGEAELETGGGEGVLLPLEAPLQVVQQDHQAVGALVSPKQSNSVGKACNGEVIPRRLLLKKLIDTWLRLSCHLPDWVEKRRQPCLNNICLSGGRAMTMTMTIGYLVCH